MSSYVKAPEEVIDFSIDWSAWLPSGDTISASTWILPAGITEDSSTNDTSSATIWLSGGTAGTSYRLINQITTTAGRVKRDSILITVEET